MTYRITKEHVWGGIIPDHADALAEKLRALANGGMNLELIIAQRDWSGHAIMYIAPLRTLEEIETAEKAGFSRKASVRALRIEGPNVPGLGSRIATSIGKAGVSARAFSAMALGERSVTTVSFDTPEDVDRAKVALEIELS
jgi:hypothetical protein